MGDAHAVAEMDAEKPKYGCPHPGRGRPRRVPSTPPMNERLPRARRG
jgi:hypothetical protein